MKIVRYTVLSAIFLIMPGVMIAQDYYQLLGIAKNSKSNEISRACTIKKTEIKTKLEPENKKIADQLQAYAKSHPAPRSDMDTLALTKYKTDIELNNAKIDGINAACEILLNPIKKEEYNKKIGIESDCVGREKRVVSEIISKDLSSKVQDLLSKQAKFVDEMEALVEQMYQAGKTEKDVEANTAPIVNRINEIQKKIDDVNKEIETDSEKIKEIMGDCPMSADWADRANKLRATIATEKKELFIKEAEALKNKKQDFTGIRGKIEKARDANIDVKITSVVGNLLSTIPIPNVGGKVFGQDLMMKKMQIVPAPSGTDVRQGIGFTGTMQFNKFDVQGTVFVIEKKDHTLGCSLALGLPENYKISDLVPSFKTLDALSLPQGKLILSNFNYTDLEGYSIKYGLNFVAKLELSGPLKMLNTLKDSAKDLKSVIVRSDPIRFQGVIPIDITKTEFSAIIPMQIGIDFTKIPQIPRTITDIFKELTTDDFRLAVTAPPKVSFTVEGGIRLVLGTQPAPLSLLFFTTVAPTNLTLGVRLKNMLELKYFALGNAGIQLDFDEGLMPAAALLGIPFTGIGLNGEIDLGLANDKRVNMKVAGGARVTSGSIPDIVLEAQATNLQFGNLLHLYNAIVKKMGVPGQVPEDKIPVMNIDKIKGYVALEDVQIAGKTYEAGFKLAVDAQLFDKKFGFDFDLRHKELVCSGSGYMSKIDLIMNGKNIFTLSGPGPDKIYGNNDDGPYVYFRFNARDIVGSTFGLKVMLDIPSIDLNSMADLEYSRGGFKADIDMNYEAFTAVFGLNFDSNHLDRTIIKFGFKGDFEKFLSEQAIPVLNKLNNRVNSELAKVDKKIGDLSNKIASAKRNAISDTDREIEKTKKVINNIENKISSLEKKCKDMLYICPAEGIEIAAQGTALVGAKAYLEGLLKPGKEVIKSVTVIEDLSAEVSKAELTRKTVTGALTVLTKATDGIAQGLKIFKVTKAIGEFSAADIAAGKLPKLIALEAEVSIPDVPKVTVKLSNLQFDFKNPQRSGLQLAEKLLEGIKIEGI